MSLCHKLLEDIRRFSYIIFVFWQYGMECSLLLWAGVWLLCAATNMQCPVYNLGVITSFHSKVCVDFLCACSPRGQSGDESSEKGLLKYIYSPQSKEAYLVPYPSITFNHHQAPILGTCTMW